MITVSFSGIYPVSYMICISPEGPRAVRPGGLYPSHRLEDEGPSADRPGGLYPSHRLENEDPEPFGRAAYYYGRMGNQTPALFRMIEGGYCLGAKA